MIKILLRFKTKWWAGAREQQFERMFFMFSNEKIPTWWTQYPEPFTTLTGWVAGPQASALAHHSDTELTDLALVSLSNIFKVSIEELQNELIVSNVINWVADPFARGGYSYPTPQTAEALQELNQPVEDTLFFAGEAMWQGYATATVEGALGSGIEAAKRVLSSNEIPAQGGEEVG